MSRRKAYALHCTKLIWAMKLVFQLEQNCLNFHWHKDFVGGSSVKSSRALECSGPSQVIDDR